MRNYLADREATLPPRNEWVFGEGLRGSRRLFELYVPGETPRDAQMIITVLVDLTSGQYDIET